VKTSGEPVKPRALILAYPELKRSIRRILGDLIQSPSSSDAGADRPAIDSTASFSASLFPPQQHAPTPPEDPSEQGRSLFEWGNYDFVILLDIFLQQETLTGPGYIFAARDYYEQGNFRSTKIILVTDPVYTWWKTARALETADASLERLQAALDRKGAIHFLRLTDPHFAKKLRGVVQGSTGNAGGTGQEQLSNEADLAELREPVMKAVAVEVRKYLSDYATVVMVEDEIEELKNIYFAVTGGMPGGWPSSETNGVDTATAWKLNGNRQETHLDFHRLIEYTERLKKNASSEGRYYMFVTDILFKLQGWDKTGIDLIEEIRRVFTHQVGIVAFTGFATPFITMSAYQRGADFVIQKGDLSRLVSGHKPITASGTDRLLMTLAFLCFQKQFLRRKRNEGDPSAWGRGHGAERFKRWAGRSIVELKRVLPKHSVSLHIQQEWLDTLYLLEAARIYDLKSPQLEWAWREVRAKYDA
jgi:hypothetical protein